MSLPESKPSDYDADFEPMLPLAARGLQTVLRDPGELFRQLRQVSEMLGNLAVAPAKPALVFRRDGKIESKEIGCALTVGRVAPCDLFFPESVEMSRRQFTITAQETGFVLTDSGSLNGTFVRGVSGRVARRDLRDGDVIESGGVTFVFIRPGNEMRGTNGPG